MNTSRAFHIALVVAGLSTASIGPSHAGVVFSEGFESGTLGSNWSTSSSTASGRVAVSDSLGAPTNSGTYHLAMDVTAVVDNLNEAILTLDLSGLADVSLSFFHKDVNDEDQALPASFVGSVNGDGVSLSVDGTNWFTLFSLNNSNSPNNVYTQFNADLSTFASNNGLTLGANTQIKFQQYDNFPFNTDGRTFDDIGVTSSSISVPESTTLALFGLGLAGLGVVARRRKTH